MGRMNILNKASRLLKYGARSRVGHCFVCGIKSLFYCERDNLKESLRCWHCGAITRTRMIAASLCDLYHVGSLADLPSHMSIYEAQASGPIHNILQLRNNYHCSEYMDDVPSGEIRNGVKSENMERLSFDNESFDIVIHQSVLEHVRHPLTALRECYRVLRKNGHLIFEVPMCDYWSPVVRGRSRPRVEVSGDKDVALLPPLYHEDPLRPEGVLVYTDFGLDLGADLNSIGFDVDWRIEYFSRSKMSHSVIAICRRNG